MTSFGRSINDSADLAGYQALRTTAAARKVARDILSVSGPDAASYLQGQVSQDVNSLTTGTGADSLLLSPQGKVEAYIRVSRLADDAFIVDTDGGFGERVEARLRRFKLRVKAEIGVLDWTCIAVRGPQSTGVIIGQPPLALRVEWPGLDGVDLLGPSPCNGDDWLDPLVQWCGAEAWEAARIEAGVPVNGRELTEGTIAAEVGLVDRSVSFTKGCFTGQELVARLDARGSKVARRLAGVVITSVESGDLPPVGSTVVTADGEHVVGSLSSMAWSPGLGAGVALATLHRRVTPPEPVTVQWQDSTGERRVEAESRPLPLID